MNNENSILLEFIKEYIQITIDKLMIRNKLHFRDLYDKYPETLRDSFDCVCDLCDSDLKLNYTMLENGVICSYCNNNNNNIQK